MHALQTKKADSIVAHFYDLYQKKQISDHLLRIRLEEYHQILREKVRWFNHYNSTSLHADHYMEIQHALNYIFLHAQTKDISGCTLHEAFDLGEEIIQQDIAQIQCLYQKMQAAPLFQNDAYLDVFHSVSLCLKQWESDRGWLTYCNIEEDLLYPLIDGIPLYHDMYQLHGSDFLLYYLQRLYIEHTFCSLFKKDLASFCQYFIETRELPMQALMINLSDLLIHQCIASQILYGTNQILFSEVDVQRFQHRSSIDPLFQQHCEEAFFTIFKDMDVSIQTYYSAFKEFILTADPVLSLIYHKEKKHLPTIQIKKYGQTYAMDALLDQLQRFPTIAKQVAYLQQLDLGIYDWIDLFDEWILFEKEYEQVWEALDETSIQILWEALKQEYDCMTINDFKNNNQIESHSWILSFLCFLEKKQYIWLTIQHMTFVFH